MQINENKIILLSGKKEKEYDILFSFEANNNLYYVYTDNIKDDDECVKVYAGMYFKDGNIEKLIPVENEEELEIIDKLLARLSKDGDKVNEK